MATKYGVTVLGSMTSANKANIIRGLGVECTRSGVILSSWGGGNAEYNAYVAAGLKVLVNLNWVATPTPQPFPTDMTAYSAKITSVLNAITPELVVIENEPLNASFHVVDIPKYVTMLQTAAPIVHGKGLKLTDGGVYGDGLQVLVYRYLKATYGQTFAENNYGHNVFASATLNYANNVGLNPTLETRVNNVKAILDADKLYCDYVNWHHYEVDNPNVDETTALTSTANVIQYTKEYIFAYTGLKIIANETATRNNTHGELVRALLQDYHNNNLDYVIWFDNYDGNIYGGIPLQDGSAPFTHRETGDAFLDFFRPAAVITPESVSISLPTNSVSVTAIGVDNNNVIVSKQWSKISGPSIYTITSPTSYNTSFTNLQQGTYVFRLTLTDALGVIGYKDLPIIVGGVANQPPVAEAGGPYTISNETQSFTLDGSGSYDDVAIVSAFWSHISGPNVGKYSIVSPLALVTQVDIISPLVAGTDIFQLQVFDAADEVGQDSAQVIVTIKPGGNGPGGLHGKKFLYYLVDANGLCYYLENGVVKSGSIDTTGRPLDKTPDGWQDILIKWERNTTYFGINRNVSNQLSFVADGATILRHLFYTKTIEEKVWLLIQKRTLDIDDTTYGFVYRFLYKGAIDLSTFKTVDRNEGFKVSCNIAEDDFSKFLKAYQAVTYELPCNSTTPGIVPVWIDGVEYSNKINYIVPAIDNSLVREYTVAMSYINQDGDDFYVFKGDQQLEEITPLDETNYAINSSNHPFVSAKPVTVTIKGTAKYISTEIHDLAYKNNLFTSLGQLFTVHRDDNVDITNPIGAGQTIIKPFNITISLAAYEKLFMYLFHINPADTSASAGVQVEILDLSISLTTRLDPTVCYCRRPLDVWKDVNNNMTANTFTSKSDLLTANKSFVITSGDAIRGVADAKMKISFNDFFGWASALLAAGISYDSKKNVELELRKKYFDNSAPIDLGIVRNAKFSLATDFSFNTLKAGYPNQNYDTINGKQEYNTTTQMSSPVTRITKEMSFVSNIRADSYGIEGIRKNYKNLDTTAAPSDNNTFFLVIEDTPRVDGYYHLKRVTYDAVSGINSPTTAYNIEGATPKNIMRANWDFIRSCFLHFDDQYFKYCTTDKNPLLSTTKAGVTITENADEKIGDSKANPYFLPVIMEFECNAPINLAELLTANPNRCFKCTYINTANVSIVVEGFNMSVGIAPNDNTPQTMKLLLSVNNDLNNLIYG